MVSSLKDVVDLFPQSSNAIASGASHAITLAKKGLDGILTLDDSKRTLENTAFALDEVCRLFSTSMCTLITLEMTHPEKEMRDAAQEAVLKMQNFSVDAFMNRDLYKAFKFVVEHNAGADLTSEQKEYLMQEMEGFELGGFNPDKVPENLIRFRGDGETYVSQRIKDLGLKTLFHPGATVYHRVPASRVTKDYFCRRSFEIGIESSFSEIRKNKSLDNSGHISCKAWVRKALTLALQVKHWVINKREPVEVGKI